MYQVEKVGKARQGLFGWEEVHSAVLGGCVSGVFKQGGESPSLRSKPEQL